LSKPKVAQEEPSRGPTEALVGEVGKTEAIIINQVHTMLSKIASTSFLIGFFNDVENVCAIGAIDVYSSVGS
jgi:hypothetical protein